MTAALYIAVGLSIAAGVSAQLLAEDEVNVTTYKNSLLLEGAGSRQRIVYEDAMGGLFQTGMIWSDIYIAPCGQWLPMIHQNLSELAYLQTGESVRIEPGS